MDYKEENKSLRTDLPSIEEQGNTTEEHTEKQKAPEKEEDRESQPKQDSETPKATNDATSEQQTAPTETPADDADHAAEATSGNGSSGELEEQADQESTGPDNDPANKGVEGASEGQEHFTAKQKPDESVPESLPDYTTYSKDGLVEAFQELLNSGDVNKHREALETIRSAFFKKRNEEIEKLKEAFEHEGGDASSFQPPQDKAEDTFKELYKQYKARKREKERLNQEQKQKNLDASEEIIQQLKDLVNTQESLGKTFNEFKELQQRWREIGPVPQNKYKDLWVRYNHNIEKFYDYVKINKELKELDLKKNMEAKKELCEMAENLLLEDDIIKAYKSLQTLHDRWREIGPVPKEKKDELWSRFRAATKQINKKHQEHFEKLKAEREKNLEAKTLLCQKAEELAELEPENHKEWEERTREIKKLQNIWRKIGFVPKKYNNKIYQRFRAANDAFFNKKREFYAQLRKDQQENLDLKRELLKQAEEMQDSTDWKTATEFYKDIQEKWKQIGPVPKKHSDAIWKKFRAACNHFFDRKREHFSEVDDKQEENLKRKRELIEEIKQYESSEDDEENLKNIRAFQDRWSEIGFVPIQNKDEIQNEFSNAINKLYENINVDDNKLAKLQYKTKVENLKQAPKSDNKLRNEREKIAAKLKKVESDITVWENNIGFFTSNSENAQSYIQEMEDKIKDAKKLAEKLKTKLDVIDEAAGN